MKESLITDINNYIPFLNSIGYYVTVREKRIAGLPEHNVHNNPFCSFVKTNSAAREYRMNCRQNNGGSLHNGQIFYYGTKISAIKKELEINTESVYYKSNGRHFIAENRFENGIHNDCLTLSTAADAGETVLTFDIQKDTSAVY